MNVLNHIRPSYILTLAGQFEVVNHKLLRDLIGLGLWNKEMKNKMLLDDGSIQNIPEIPDRIKAYL